MAPKSLEEPVLLIKRRSETIKNKTKKQKDRFLGILLGLISPCLLGDPLAGLIRTSEEMKAKGQETTTLSWGKGAEK